MSDHARFIELAQRLIDKHGRTVTLEVLSSTPADANKPWKGAATPTVASNFAPVKGVFVPLASAEALGLKITDNELLRGVNETLLVAGSDDDFRACNSVSDNSVRHRIKFAEVLAPGDQIVLYYFGIER